MRKYRHNCEPKAKQSRKENRIASLPAIARATAWLLAVTAIATLSACVPREHADVKLARGCAAAAEAMLPEDQKIKEVKGNVYSDSAEFGDGFRVVKTDIVQSDGWADVDKTITCVFVEQFGFLNSSHTAHIHQLKMDDKVWGKDGDQVIGSYEDNLKLTEKVDKAMSGL